MAIRFVLLTRLPMAIKFFCPSGHRLSAPDGHVGRTIRCPACRQAAIVPELSTEAADTPAAKPSLSFPDQPTAGGTKSDVGTEPKPARRKEPPPVKHIKQAKPAGKPEASDVAGPDRSPWADAVAEPSDVNPTPRATSGKAPPPVPPKAKGRPPKRLRPKPPPPPPPPKPTPGDRSAGSLPIETETDETDADKSSQSEPSRATSTTTPPPPPSSDERSAEGARRRGRRGRRRRDRHPEAQEKQPETEQEFETRAPERPRKRRRFGRRVRVMGPHVYRPDRGRLQSLQWLAAILGLVILFSVAPAVGMGYLAIESAPGWARLVLAMAAIELVFVVWMLATPDWASVWVVMIVFGCASTIYAMGTSLVLATPLDQTMPLGLGQIRHWAGPWFGAVLAVQCLGTYLCGRASSRWHRMFQLEMAGRGKSQGGKG